MNVLVCDPLPEEAIDAMREGGLQVTVETGTTPDRLFQIVGGFDAMVVRSATKVTREVIDAAENLKLIVRGGVGLDNIDTGDAKGK